MGVWVSLPYLYGTSACPIRSTLGWKDLDVSGRIILLTPPSGSSPPDHVEPEMEDAGMPGLDGSKPTHSHGRRFTALLLPLLLGGCGILGLSDDPQQEPNEDQTTVLFIGSSYLKFNNIPDRFRDLSRKAGEKVFVRYHLSLGQPLSYFASSQAATDAIRSLDWDYIVLQGGAQSVAYPSSGETSVYQALRELHRKATEDSPGTKVVYMMPWAFEDGMLWVEGRTEGYEEMQLDIREPTLAWAEELGLVIAPVGMAWYEVLTTWPHGEHFLHDSDWNHASKLGSYLTAATIFSTIWARDASEVNYNWEIEKEMAQELREVAGRTVMDNLTLWGITG
jgi:hypothetical protein